MTKPTEAAMRAAKQIVIDDVATAAAIIDRETKLKEKEAALRGLIRCMEGDGNRWRHCRDLDDARKEIANAEKG